MEHENEQVVEEKVVEETVVEETVETPPTEEPVEETPPKEVDPKDAVIGGMRRKLRTAELEAARLQGQIQAQQTGPAEKSPLELAAEEQRVSVDEVVITGKVHKAEQAFAAKQAAVKATQQAVQDYQAGSEAAVLTMTDDTMGEGLGVTSLGEIGEHLLTDDDRREIYAAGKKCGPMLYKKLKQRILQAGGPAAQELQKRLKPPQAKTKAKAKEKDKSEEKPEPPSQEVLLDSDAQIESQFDL